jgi:hypothetical protein
LAIVVSWLATLRKPTVPRPGGTIGLLVYVARRADLDPRDTNSAAAHSRNQIEVIGRILRLRLANAAPRLNL